MHVQYFFPVLMYKTFSLVEVLGFLYLCFLVKKQCVNFVWIAALPSEQNVSKACYNTHRQVCTALEGYTVSSTFVLMTLRNTALTLQSIVTKLEWDWPMQHFPRWHHVVCDRAEPDFFASGCIVLMELSPERSLHQSLHSACTCHFRSPQQLNHSSIISSAHRGGEQDPGVGAVVCQSPLNNLGQCRKGSTLSFTVAFQILRTGLFEVPEDIMCLTVMSLFLCKLRTLPLFFIHYLL